MPHGPLPPVPILVLPKDVSDELVEAGVVTRERNPIGEFAVGDWWVGVLTVTGAAGGAVTLIGSARASLTKIAQRLHGWNERRSSTVAPPGPTEQCWLMYQTERGAVILDLNERPPLPELEAWLRATYAILEDEAGSRG